MSDNKIIDCTFPTELGKFNFRVGVIIMNGRKILMAKNPNETRDFYYSVGGRVRFGDSLTDAAIREIREETGVTCEIDRIAAIHENFFTDGDGVPFHEISVFFLIKPDERLLSVKNGAATDGGPNGEYLEWIDMDNCYGKTIYPEFYRTVDFSKESGILHFISRDADLPNTRT